MNPADHGSADLFCDVSLAARIERAERQLLAEAAAVAARRLDGVLALPLGGGFVSYAEPGSPLNKISGLGFAPLDLHDLAAVEARLHARACPVQVELPSLAEPSVGERLTRRGYVLMGVEQVLGRRITAADAEAPLPDGVTVTESPLADLEPWLHTLTTGFLSADGQGVQSHETFEQEALTQTMRDFVQAEGMIRLAAAVNGQRAGGASLRLTDGVAQLCGAATLPALRRRGVQTALLTARLALAARAGADLAVITTMPGSRSMQNAQRRGFVPLYVRNLLVLAPDSV
ncbi:MAG: GNAT family N-acetyltransferase [Deltaproteobacteria bacterium]|nr:GNAT family N-acetyltransferase [Deltaproteobacteria bacterium]